jgi:hypothetical protein
VCVGVAGIWRADMEIFIQRNEKVIICANANLLYYSIRVFFAGISNGFILNRDEPRIHILKDFFYRVYRLKLYRLINTHVRDYKSWAIYNIGSCYGFRSNNFCFCSISNFARGLYRFLYRRMFTFHQRLMLICWARQISNSERP